MTNVPQGTLLFVGDCDCCDAPPIEPFRARKQFGCSGTNDEPKLQIDRVRTLCSNGSSAWNFPGGGPTCSAEWDEAVANANECLTCTEDGTDGANSPSTTGVSGTGDTWSNTGNATAQDDTYATVVHSSGTSEFLEVTNFGFSLPASSTVTGITVEIDRNGTPSAITDNTITLLGVTGTPENKADTVTNWPSSDTDTYVSYGGKCDRWGASPTQSDVESSSFGVQIAVDLAAASSASIDHVRVTVHYGTIGKDCTDINDWDTIAGVHVGGAGNFDSDCRIASGGTIVAVPQACHIVASGVLGAGETTLQRTWYGTFEELDDEDYDCEITASLSIVMSGVLVPMTSGQSLSVTHSVADLNFQTWWTDDPLGGNSGWVGEYQQEEGKDLQCGRLRTEFHGECDTLPSPSEAVVAYYGDAATVDQCFQDVIDGNGTADLSFTPTINLTKTQRTRTGAPVNHVMSADGFWYYIFTTTTKCRTSINPTYPGADSDHVVDAAYSIESSPFSGTNWGSFEFRDSGATVLQTV